MNAMGDRLTRNAILDFFVPDDLFNDFQILRGIDVAEHKTVATNAFLPWSTLHIHLSVAWNDDQIDFEVDDFEIGPTSDTRHCQGRIVAFGGAYADLVVGMSCELTWLLQTLAMHGKEGAPPSTRALSLFYSNADMLRDFVNPDGVFSAPELALPLWLPQFVHA